MVCRSHAYASSSSPSSLCVTTCGTRGKREGKRDVLVTPDRERTGSTCDQTALIADKSAAADAVGDTFAVKRSKTLADIARFTPAVACSEL